MHETVIRQGDLLISEPSIIGDESFSRSVVLISEHNDEGIVGFILNKKLEYQLDDLIPEVTCSFDIFQGGPVNTDNLYFIHKVPNLIPGTHLIKDGIYWGGDFEVVKGLLNNQQIKTSEIKFFLGYSGWNVHQLENEIDQQSWVVTSDIHEKTVFSQLSSSIWKSSMKKLGGAYQLWSNAPENPQLN
ncbi:MAG: YqgE/AlgH family protein [Nonlabens sp.]